MRKKLLFVLSINLLSFSFVIAQTLRTSLYEVFTSEDCGPCVFQNASINSVVNSNQSPRKIIILRYQVGIPTPPLSPTSLYQQNPIEPAARHSYYVSSLNNQGVPQGFLNGLEYTANPNPFSPAIITQASITSAYINNAPFAMTLSHSLSPLLDSVKIKYSISAAQAFTTNNPLKLHIAICEQNIHYAIAPGTNGETDFEWIMRKMVPDVNGKTLAATWQSGQIVTDSITVAVPNYIWDKNELTIVAFIQEDKPILNPTSAKTVHQTAYSAKQPLNVDVSAYGSFIEQLTCSTTLNTRFTFKNTGLATLTSASIEYDLNGGVPQSLAWAGSLATGDTASVVIPPIFGLIQGVINKVRVKIKLPNGLVDYNTASDVKEIAVDVLPVPSTIPSLSQNFSSTIFPPTNWHSISDDNVPLTRSTAGNNGSGSAKFDFYNSAVGRIDELLIENQNFTTVNNATLTFDVASAPYGSNTFPENDQLKVMVSENCGINWITVYQKAGAVLNSALAVQTTFIPTMASQWRPEIVALPTFTNPSNVIIKFVGISGFGNNTYIDNINLNKVLSIPSLAAIKMNQLDLFPNPTKDNLQVRFTTFNPKPTELKLFNALGQIVKIQQLDKLVVGLNELNVDVKDLSNGIYSVQLNQNNFTVSKSFIVQQ
jgi:Secretion system C-terminal sorting domain